jgi:hypothetical protein
MLLSYLVQSVLQPILRQHVLDQLMCMLGAAGESGAICRAPDIAC